MLYCFGMIRGKSLVFFDQVVTDSPVSLLHKDLYLNASLAMSENVFRLLVYMVGIFIDFIRRCT